MVELLFDIIFELIGVGVEEIIENKKISKWIRYPVIAFVKNTKIIDIGTK